ncbi:MAG: glycosyltransferase [Pirellulaceae bacterium]|nr:glycosyltransferase [Pirellulaceae bacterium]
MDILHTESSSATARVGRPAAGGAVLRIASVSTNLPTADKPEHGVFVQRRLAAMAQMADVHAVRPQPWFPLWTRTSPPIADGGFPVLPCRMFYLPRVLKQLDAWWLRRAVAPVVRGLHQSHGLHLIDAHFGYPTGVGCWRLGQRLGIPVFITLRGVESQQINDRRRGPLLREALCGCAGVIAVSRSLQQVALRAGVDPERLTMIPNAIDAAMFHPGKREAARRKLGMPLDAPLVISVGSLIQRKGYHDLLPAFQAARRVHRSARLVIVGGPSHESHYPQRLERQIDQLGLRSAVHLAGPVPPREVGDWLRAADVFALATYREGCCNALLEAISCGLPAVVTPAGDNARYVDGDENGFVVPIGDVPAWADALTEALGRNWDRQRIARRLQQIGWSEVASRVLGFMRSRLAARSA